MRETTEGGKRLAPVAHKLHGPHGTITLRELANHVPGAVGRSIVDENNLVRALGTIQFQAKLPQQFRQAIPGPVNRDHDRKV